MYEVASKLFSVANGSRMIANRSGNLQFKGGNLEEPMVDCLRVNDDWALDLAGNCGGGNEG